jgi:hypothetical protein
LFTGAKFDKENKMVTKYGGKYVVDEKGKAVSVLLDIKTYRRLVKDLEELESIRAYDAAISSCDEVVPFEQAIQEIEKSRE